MGARADALAKQFEVKVEEATALFETLTEREWKKKSSAEKWPVGVVVHHIAVGHEQIGGIIKAIADGGPMPELSMDKIHSLNAEHAREQANTTKAEALALHEKSAAAVAAMLRGLDDAALERKATVLPGAPPMGAGELAEGLLVGHIDEHLGAIRVAIGR